MALRVANNVSAINAQRNLNKSQNMLATSLERLSSGLRINKASDDAAGLSISQNFRADIASFKMASKNASQATAMLQTAEGGMDQIHNMLTRLKELSTQAASDNVTGNRSDINAEAQQLITEIDRIANSTKYSGTALLDGYGKSTSAFDTAETNVQSGTVDISSYDVSGADAGDYTVTASGAELTITQAVESGTLSQTVTLAADSTADFDAFDISLTLSSDASASGIAGDLAGTITVNASGGTFQIGADNDGNNRVNFSIDSVQSSDLGVNSLNLTTLASAQDAMDLVDTAISTVNTARASIGANQNRLSYASANLATSIENATAAESVIRDTDIASEMTQFTKSQILQQAGTAMLAQANALPQAALSLLG
ncbi:MAG: flagellin [Candidatus Marinimicrobia bacterium]|nr:flagellin [Candidatus Neomarinimicrobiota bacterium]MCF7880543.1 flagellin [Candidatus Neomarinimicrobiota bacterium]